MTISSIFNGNVKSLKKKLLNDGKLLLTIIEKDKEAVQIKKVKNIGPDYWLIASQMMTNLYRSFEDKNEDDEEDEIRDVVMGNNEFVDYVRDVALSREAETSEFFNNDIDSVSESESDTTGDDDDEIYGYDVDDEMVPDA
ncbi:hypothetical protein QTN25_010445 [Entamoeba marina]